MSIPCIDLLGMGSLKWNIKATIKALKNSDGFGIGLFADETFGPNAIKNIRKCLDTGKVKLVRAQLNWKGPNPSHALPPLSKVKKLAPQWEKLAKEYPATKFYVSPSCEYQSMDKKAVKQMLETAKQLAPSCTIVNNPMTSASAPIPGYIYELHGDKKMGANQAISFDGGSGDGQEGLYNIDAENWVKKNSKAEYSMAWAVLCNMQEAHNTLTPTQRTESPSYEFTMGLYHLFTESGTAPTPDFKVIIVKRPLLWKSFAEDSPGKDRRHNRPMFLSKVKSSYVEIVTVDGKVLGKMPYWGSFGDGLSRYYAGSAGGIGLYAWQIMEKAKEVSGFPWFWIKQGKNYYGPLNHFRKGYF